MSLTLEKLAMIQIRNDFHHINIFEVTPILRSLSSLALFKPDAQHK